MARFTGSCALVVALALVLACSDDAPRPDDAPAEVTVQVGAKGGTLKASGGMTLEIPEGALDRSVKISAKNAGQTAPKQLRAEQVSDLYEFGPEGTKFNKDVKITFEMNKVEPRAEVYFTKEDGSGFEKIASQKDGRRVTALVKHFSQGFVGVPLDEMDAGVESDAGVEEASTEEASTEDVDADVGPALDAGDAFDAETSTGPDPVPDAGAPAADAGAEAAVDGAVIPTTHIVVHSRDRFGVLVNQTWAAFQDGQGAWQALSPSTTAGVYEFDVMSSTFGVAFVCSSQDLVNSWGTLSFEPSSTTVLDVTTVGTPCTQGSAPAAYTLDGTIYFGTSGMYYWREGHAHLSGGINFYGGISTSVFLSDLRHNEANDLLFSMGTGSYGISKFLVRRDVVLTANATGHSFDMGKDGFNALGTAQAQALNASDVTSVDVRYVTRGTADGLWLNTGLTSGTTARMAPFATLPENVRRSTDRYLLAAAEETSGVWRKASYATYTTSNLSVILPPAFATGFAAVDTPYLRPTYDFTKVAGASLYAFGMTYSPLRASMHSFSIEIDPAWLSGSASQTFTFPDFSQVQGFDPSWVAPSAATISAQAAVHVWTSDALGELKTEAGQSATVVGPGTGTL